MNRSYTKSALLLLFLVFQSFSCAQVENEDIGWNNVEAILQNIKPPVFPDKEFDITSYGAIGDGVKDCTEEIRNAINECKK